MSQTRTCPSITMFHMGSSISYYCLEVVSCSPGVLVWMKLTCVVGCCWDSKYRALRESNGMDGEAWQHYDRRRRSLERLQDERTLVYNTPPYSPSALRRCILLCVCACTKERKTRHQPSASQDSAQKPESMKRGDKYCA